MGSSYFLFVIPKLNPSFCPLIHSPLSVMTSKKLEGKKKSLMHTTLNILHFVTRNQMCDQIPVCYHRS
jgi:hypothetical protein